MEQSMEQRVLLLRSCRADFTAHGGYRWPSEVGGTCRPERWNPNPVCGDGLHGFLRGEGDAGLADWSERAQWLVFSADVADVVAIDTCKAKVAAARVEHVGKGDRLRDCLKFMEDAGQLGQMAIGVVREGGDGSTLTGGARSTLTGGDDSTLTGGDGSTLTGGDGSTLTGGYGSTLTGGRGCTMIFRWYDYSASRWRLATADEVLKPDTAYTVRDGKIVEAKGS